MTSTWIGTSQIDLIGGMAVPPRRPCWGGAAMVLQRFPASPSAICVKASTAGRIADVAPAAY